MDDFKPFAYLRNNRLKPKAGRLLISEPFLHDPYFKRSVVLLAEHNENGSMGFVINKSVNMKMDEAVVDFPDFSSSLYFGGPVNRDLLFYIHTVPAKIEGSIEISKGLYWGGKFEDIKIMIEKNRILEHEIRFFVGYSGWEAGQLQAEIKQKSWIVCRAEVPVIMSHNAEHMWKEILSSMGKEFAIAAGFPEDPSLN